MKDLDEYRDLDIAAGLRRAIAETTTRPWVLMEVCGGQTHSIVRYGVDRMIPPAIELVHGPGCPVCVTSLEMIDRAHAIASRPDVIFTSFGDMLRVPASRGDLLTLKSRGADVRVVYSPLDALRIARDNPRRRVVFFGIGFETTAPPNAMAILQAHRQGLENFSMLVSHVLVPPAIAAILQAPGNRVQAFLGPGHVCAVMGYREYEALCERYRVPIVITGFEPVDLLDGILMAVRQLEEGRAEVENQKAWRSRARSRATRHPSTIWWRRRWTPVRASMRCATPRGAAWLRRWWRSRHAAASASRSTSAPFPCATWCVERARFSDSTRSWWRTRASWSPSSPPRMPTRCSPRCGDIRSAGTPPASAA